MTIDYGFSSTDDIEYDKKGLPLGKGLLVMIVGEEAAKDDKGVVVEYEILEGAFKGQKGKQWILTKHENPQTSNIAKQTLKRIADATGKPVTPVQPLKGRVLRIDVRQQKKNPEYTEISGYHPENHVTEESAPF